jgi:hypothetical protein
MKKINIRKEWTEANKKEKNARMNEVVDYISFLANSDKQMALLENMIVNIEKIDEKYDAIMDFTNAHWGKHAERIQETLY